MKHVLSVLALAGLAYTPAYAGSIADPVVETIAPPPAAPVPQPYTGGEWTGFYGGLQLGNLDVDGTGTADGDDVSIGVHAGYDYDFGRFVLGGEVDYDFTDVDLAGAATVDSVARLKLRAGYDLGRTLLYATAGVAQVDTSIGSETGEFGGLGVAYQINDRFVVGGEVLTHSFDDIGGSGVEADATSINIRSSFRF
ncbi:outer membrane beta-barrel protein [Pseudosulfitobacter sp. SM2401]|uniref:outer membrane protein n=1 Tax=Pseudosulfitobacter sp. SM2401 TaxID=3350098 RepID=UPI0036F3B9EA